MKINMTNQTIMNTLELLNKFAEVTGPLAWAIRKTKKGLEEETRIFIEERDKIIKKYDIYDEEGKVKNPDDIETIQKFLDEINGLINITSEVDIFQVSQETFDKADIYEDGCSVRDYDVLEAIMVEGRLKLVGPNGEEITDEEEKPVEEEKAEETED